MVAGGVAAAFGFRYQNLVTAELLLELYESSTTDWLVAVDLQGQDSADILVYPRPGAVPDIAIQVKASLPSSATTMAKPEAERLLAAIATEHPNALERVVRTNRLLTNPAADLRDDLRRRPLGGGATRERIDARDEGVRGVSAQLIERIARLRRRGGIGAELHHILLALLLDMVQRCGSQASAQLVNRPMVEAILDEPTATIADAAGRRGWGLAYGAPVPDAVERPEIVSFLSKALGDEALRSGVPRAAVLAGPHGAGKSVATGLWAARRREHYALTIWLDATSSARLAEQSPELIRWLDGDAVSATGTGTGTIQAEGREPTPEDLAQSFQDSLAALPVPWLLVLDGAVDPADLRSWIPASGYGHIAITTHRGDWPRDLAPQLFIDTMPDASATALIRHRLADPDSSWEEPLDLIAIDFAHRLGRWPLAIDLGCAWVRRLGGDLSRLPDFTARLDRFHITEEDGTGLGGYPRAVGVLVRELWNSLSEQAQSVLAIVVVSGGSSIPANLLEGWGQTVCSRSPFTIDVRSAVHELVSVSLLTRRLRGDARSISRYDEIVSAHDGIRVTLEQAGIGVPVALTSTWLEVCADALLNAIGPGRIADAGALAPPISAFLEGLLVSTAEVVGDHDPDATTNQSSSVSGPAEDAEDANDTDLDGHGLHRMLRMKTTTVMHNLGFLALLSGRFERAAYWLSYAVTVREEHYSDVDREHRPNLAATQIQTLGQLIQAEAHRRAFERIRPIALRALAYAEDPRVFDVTDIDPPVAPMLCNIAENTHLASEDCADLRARIEQSLNGRDTAYRASTALAARVNDFYIATQQASELAEEEQWSRAVEAVLAAVTPSAYDGALLSESVEAVLDVALLLIGSMLRRSPDTLAESWWSAFRGLAAWCESVEITDQRQLAKASLLGPIAEADKDALNRAIEGTAALVTGDQQLEAWMNFAVFAREWLDRPSNGILSELGSMAPGMMIFRRVGIQDEPLFRPVLHEGQPGLVVCTPGLLVRTVDGEVDHTRHTLLEHGFPDGPDGSGKPRVAEGWVLRIDGNGGYTLTDPRGEVLLVFEPAGETPAHSRIDAWREAMEQTGMVSIICRDPADTELTNLFATPQQGLVRVAGPEDGWSHGIGLRGLIEQLRSHLRFFWHA